MAGGVATAAVAGILPDESDLSAMELCLRFAAGHPQVETTPIGCRTVEHLEQSVRVVEQGPLPSNILKQLDQLAAMVPRRPREEPMILPFDSDYIGLGIGNMGAAVQVARVKLPEASAAG